MDNPSNARLSPEAVLSLQSSLLSLSTVEYLKIIRIRLDNEIEDRQDPIRDAAIEEVGRLLKNGIITLAESKRSAMKKVTEHIENERLLKKNVLELVESERLLKERVAELVESERSSKKKVVKHVESERVLKRNVLDLVESERLLKERATELIESKSSLKKKVVEVLERKRSLNKKIEGLETEVGVLKTRLDAKVTTIATLRKKAALKEPIFQVGVDIRMGRLEQAKEATWKSYTPRGAIIARRHIAAHEGNWKADSALIELGYRELEDFNDAGAKPADLWSHLYWLPPMDVFSTTALPWGLVDAVDHNFTIESIRANSTEADRARRTVALNSTKYLSMRFDELQKSVGSERKELCASWRNDVAVLSSMAELRTAKDDAVRDSRWNKGRRTLDLVSNGLGSQNSSEPDDVRIRRPALTQRPHHPPQSPNNSSARLKDAV